MPRALHDLAAHRLSSEIARELYRLVEPWPVFPQSVIGRQMVRAAFSVPANLAEGTGRWGRQDQRRFIAIARASAYEAENWLMQAEELDLIRAGYRDRWSEVGRVVNGLFKGWPSH